MTASTLVCPCFCLWARPLTLTSAPLRTLDSSSLLHTVCSCLQKGICHKTTKHLCKLVWCDDPWQRKQPKNNNNKSVPVSPVSQLVELVLVVQLACFSAVFQHYSRCLLLFFQVTACLLWQLMNSVTLWAWPIPRTPLLSCTPVTGNAAEHSTPCPQMTSRGSRCSTVRDTLCMIHMRSWSFTFLTSSILPFLR